MTDNMAKWKLLLEVVKDTDCTPMHSSGHLVNTFMLYSKILTSPGVSLKDDLSGKLCNLWFAVILRTRMIRKSTVNWYLNQFVVVSKYVGVKFLIRTLKGVLCSTAYLLTT
jgi:hypothetical protein